MAERWQADLPFTTRMNSISRISTRLSAFGEVAKIAFGEAQRLEQQLLDAATSLQDYDARLDTLLDDLSRVDRTETASSTCVTGDTNDDDTLPEVGAPSFGTYKNAISFRDGLFSTIYRSKTPHNGNKSFTGPQTPGTAVALKVTYLSAMTPPHDSAREVRLLRKAASEHIIPLWDVFRDEGSGNLVLVFPYMQHDLEGLLRRDDFTRSQGIGFLRDMFLGLNHVHSLGMIHRDIKPSNILISPTQGHSRTGVKAVLADFGIAWHATDPSSESADNKITDVGTTSYRAPELLFGLSNYDHTIDLWAAGCVAAEVLSRPHESLFDAGELGSDLALINSMFQKLGTPHAERWPELATLPDWGKVRFFDYPTKPWSELLPNMTEEGRSLVASLVVYSCERRLDAEEVLKHPLFAIVNETHTK